MKVIFKLTAGILFTVFWVFGVNSYAAPGLRSADSVSIPADSSQVNLRTFPARKLEAFRADRDFQYGTDVRPITSAWDRFWQQVQEYFAKVLRSRSYEGFWKYVLYTLVIGLTVYVVLKLLQVEFTGLFGKNVKAFAVPYETHTENIHELDFNALLDEAVQQQDYRRAIRLYYLHTLKQLTDRELIDWQPGKTNHIYIRELQANALRHDFEKITALFEYVWYGGSRVTEAHFSTTRQAFVAFNQLIGRYA